MKASAFISIVLAATMGFSGLTMAHCADDAVDICNSKHPNPDSSQQARDRYELCINTQLSQKCPDSGSSRVSGIDNLTTDKKPVVRAALKSTSRASQ